MEIQVFTYTGYKWIVHTDPIEVQPEWHICTHQKTWLHKVSSDPYMGQGSKAILFFQFTTRLGRHILDAQTTLDLAAATSGTHSMFLKNYHQVLAENLETKSREAN